MLYDLTPSLPEGLIMDHSILVELKVTKQDLNLKLKFATRDGDFISFGASYNYSWFSK